MSQPIPGTTPTPAPTGGQPRPAPLPTPPPTGVPTPGASPAGTPTGTAPAGTESHLNLTQADLNRIIDERMKRQEKSLTDAFAKQQTEQQQRWAAALGVAPDADVDPAKALEQAQKAATAAQDRADLADARSLAAVAGIEPDHIDLFLKLVDLGPLKGVDRADTGAVTTAIKAAVDTALTSAPMFKAAPKLPRSSGGDRQTPGAPTLDEQIASAEKSGDHRTALSLKRRKAFNGQ